MKFAEANARHHRVLELLEKKYNPKLAKAKTDEQRQALVDEFLEQVQGAGQLFRKKVGFTYDKDGNFTGLEFKDTRKGVRN